MRSKGHKTFGLNVKVKSGHFVVRKRHQITPECYNNCRDSTYRPENFIKMNATDVTQRTSELLGRVRYGKEVIVIHHHNQPSVVMLPYEVYAQQDMILLSK